MASEMRLGVVGALYRAVPELVGAPLAATGLAITTQRWRELGLRAAVIADDRTRVGVDAAGHIDCDDRQGEQVKRSHPFGGAPLDRS